LFIKESEDNMENLYLNIEEVKEKLLGSKNHARDIIKCVL